MIGHSNSLGTLPSILDSKNENKGNQSQTCKTKNIYSIQDNLIIVVKTTLSLAKKKFYPVGIVWEMSNCRLWRFLKIDAGWLVGKSVVIHEQSAIRWSYFLRRVIDYKDQSRGSIKVKQWIKEFFTLKWCRKLQKRLWSSAHGLRVWKKLQKRCKPY